jgi:hypothetical protein
MQKKIFSITILIFLILASSVTAISINKIETKSETVLKNSLTYEEYVGYMSISPGTLEKMWEDYQINVELNPDFGGDENTFTIQHNSEITFTADYEIKYDSLVLPEKWIFILYIYGYIDGSIVKILHDYVSIDDFDEWDRDDKTKGSLEITINWNDFDQITAILDVSYWRIPWEGAQNRFEETDLVDINILENIAPTTPTIRGTQSGTIDTDYEYTIFSEDIEGDDIYYYIDWGDKENIDWIGPYESGELITLTHNWSKKGNYEIKVKAKDDYNGAKSNWGLLTIQMPKTKIVLINIFAKIMSKFSVFQKLVKL